MISDTRKRVIGDAKEGNCFRRHFHLAGGLIVGQRKREPHCLLLTTLLGLCRAFFFNALTSFFPQTIVQIGSHLCTKYKVHAAFHVSWTLACLTNLVVQMARVLLGMGRNGDMTSLGSRSGDSWEWFGYLFATSSEGEDTLLVRTNTPFSAGGKRTPGILEGI